MKRIFNTLAVLSILAVTAACDFDNKALAPAGESLAPEAVAALSISVEAVADSSFTVTFTPQDEVLAYSYVISDSEISSPDSSSVYALRYSGLEAQRIVFEKNSTWTVNMENLEPNSTYYIYAVAANAQNNVSSVFSTSVSTSDSEAPVIVDWDFEENQVILAFSEAVSYVAGKDITAVVYAGLYPTGSPVIASTKAEVVVAGNYALLTFDEIKVPGSIYTVAIPAGAFKDAVGQATEDAVVSAITGVDNDGDPIFAAGSIYGALENADLEYELGTTTVITNYNSYTKLIKTKQMISKVQPNKCVAKIVHEGGGVTNTTEYNLGSAPYYGALSYYDIGAKLKAAPQGGDYVTFTLLEGAVLDIYGNTNANDIEIGPILFSYGFTVADVVGTYLNGGESGYGPTYDEEQWNITIEASDNPAKGNVMVTNYYSLPCKIYANWDGDRGIFTMPIYYEDLGGLVLGSYYYAFYTFAYYSAAKEQKTALELYMSKKGSFYDGNDYPGYYYEVYAMPASGNVEDITDDDYVGYYDYNIFVPEFEILTGAASGVQSASSRNYDVPAYKAERRVFNRVLVAE